MKRYAASISVILLVLGTTMSLLWMLGTPYHYVPNHNADAKEYPDVDLSRSRKTVSPVRGVIGEMLTYVVTLVNSGKSSTTNVMLTDYIPLHTTYVTSSARASSGVLISPDDITGTLHYSGTLTYKNAIIWTGSITPEETATITFCVTVSNDAPILNTAILTDEHGTYIILTAWANIRPIYMPLVLRNFRQQVSLLGVALEGYKEEFGLAQALELGVRWGRRWQHISWRDLEPEEGEYHWEVLSSLEEELLLARASGIEPILVIQMTPTWAQKVKPYACGPIRADKFDAFARFMEHLVARYGTASPYGVRYWQLGNEMDVAPEEVGPESVFGCWGDPSDSYYGGGHYAEMLKVVYPRIKAVDSQAQVMMGGLLLECDPYVMRVGDECRNELRWKSGFFLEGVMRAGGGEYFDIADVHSYAEMRPDLPARMHSQYAFGGDVGGTGLPEKVAFVRSVMGRYGYGDKPVIAGELALKCEEPTDECYEVAAAFVPRAYAEAYGLGLVGGIYYTLISENSYQSKYKGLLLPDFTPRPAFWAYRFMSGQLIGAGYLGAATNYPGVSGYRFTRAGEELEILWSADGHDQLIDIPPGFLAAYDKYGRPLVLNSENLVIGWSPIYVSIENDKAE